MKKAPAMLFSLLLACVTCSSFTGSRTAEAVYAGVTTARVLPANVTVKLGQPFSVNVTFENIPDMRPSDGVVGCEFNITWNSSILRGVSMQDIGFRTAAPENESWNIWGIKNVVSNGFALYSYTWGYLDRAISQGYAPFIGNGTWASITLVSVASGETDLHFSSIKMSGWTSGRPPYRNGVDGKVCVIHVLAGDLDLDGTVDIVDTMELAQAFGSTDGSPNWSIDCDLNGDSAIDILDAVIIGNNFGRTAQ